MKKPMQWKKTKFNSYVIAGLVVYLLLFSVFALYHVYVANELEDSHGCAIGEWVHLGQQAAVSFFLLFSVYLLSCCPDKNITIFLIRTLLWKDHPKRGPPPTLLPI
jgi:hypothetical protein